MPDTTIKGATENLTGLVHAYILRHAIFAPGDTVVVAVSGGADSLCLLLVLHELAPALGVRLRVAHLDHALRPDSDADAAFVADRARALDLPCTTKRVDIAALARRERLSLETAARAARYDVLRTVKDQEGAGVIATGHTRDDQAETVLMHLARGSGIDGLAGMPPRRGDLARPLLEVGHAETLAYCAARGVTPREDESNLSPAHRRNRVRHEVLPPLGDIYPGAAANVARAARLLTGDLALLDRLARRALDDATTEAGPSRVVLSAARWDSAEPELRPHMLRLLSRRLLGDAAGFDERAHAAILAACAPDARDRTLALPKGLALARRGDTVILGRPEPVSQARGVRDAVLPVPGVVDTGVGLLRAERAIAPRDWGDVPPDVAYLDPAAAGPALAVRAWRPGDRVRPLGLGGTRKLQDLFVDRKVPRDARRRIPVVAGARGIAWVAGLCIGEAYRVEPGGEAVRLTWEPDAPLEG